jgi:hypothetical protein
MWTKTDRSDAWTVVVRCEGGKVIQVSVLEPSDCDPNMLAPEDWISRAHDALHDLGCDGVLDTADQLGASGETIYTVEVQSEGVRS